MASSTGWVNGLLTGNTPVRAQAKLESAGIWNAFDRDFAYFGNEALSRGALVSSSVAAIRSAGCSVALVIGDTPLDIRSAKEHGLQAVAVATGPYSATELKELDSDLLISNLESGATLFAELLNSAHS